MSNSIFIDSNLLLNIKTYTVIFGMQISHL